MKPKLACVLTEDECEELCQLLEFLTVGNPSRYYVWNDGSVDWKHPLTVAIGKVYATAGKGVPQVPGAT